MTPKMTLVVALFVGGLVALAVGCQTYDFEPVSPLALSQTTQTIDVTAVSATPDVMLVIDRSGSMTLPFEVQPNCYVDGGSGPVLCGSDTTLYPLCDPSVCPSRWATLTNTLTASNTGFLDQNATVARMGVTFFPQVAATDNLGCSPASTVNIAIATSDSQAGAQAAAIKSAILNVKEVPYSDLHHPPALDGNVGGGTPTGESLKFVAANGNFDTTGVRNNYMLLLTDGLPNCNPQAGYDYSADPVACNCTESNANVCRQYSPQTCTDRTQTPAKIAAIAAAADGGAGTVRTIVVGYGDVNGSVADQTLQAMAVAGQFNRQCYVDGGECAAADIGCFQGVDAGVVTRNCDQQFFRAANQQQLANALAAITKALPAPNPCLLQLASTPSDPNLLSVVVTDNGVQTPYYYDPNSATAVWVLEKGNNIRFQLGKQGSVCEKLTSHQDTMGVVVKVAKPL